MAAGGAMALANPLSMVSPSEGVMGAVRTFAGYFAARNLVLPVLLVVALAIRARGMLNCLMLLTAFIQVMDAILDCVESRWRILPGAVVIGVLFFVGAAKLSGHPFWRKDVWTT